MREYHAVHLDEGEAIEPLSVTVFVDPAKGPMAAVTVGSTEFYAAPDDLERAFGEVHHAIIRAIGATKTDEQLEQELLPYGVYQFQGGAVIDAPPLARYGSFEEAYDDAQHAMQTVGGIFAPATDAEVAEMLAAQSMAQGDAEERRAS